MIIDPFGEIIAESNALEDDVVVGLCTTRKNTGLIGLSVFTGTSARMLPKTHRTLVGYNETRHQPRLAVGQTRRSSLRVYSETIFQSLPPSQVLRNVDKSTN